jgi:hypothetical protein
MSVPVPVHDSAEASESHFGRGLPAGRGFLIVRIVLGLLLLTAAGLKLYGLNVTALPRVGWFATPRCQSTAADSAEVCRTRLAGADRQPAA